MQITAIIPAFNEEISIGSYSSEKVDRKTIFQKIDEETSKLMKDNKWNNNKLKIGEI